MRRSWDTRASSPWSRASARYGGSDVSVNEIGAGTVRLGLDIGGTKVVFVLLRPSTGIIGESRIENWTTGDPERDLSALLGAAHTLVDAHGGHVEGGGVSSPGPIDVPRGLVIRSPNLPGWDHVPLIDRLQSEFGGRFLLENDANCAALAEWQFGAGKGRRSMLFLTMSTGVGGGLILNGQLVRGATFQAGELGHMPLVLQGRACSCGLRGCLEAYTGGRALAQRIREDIAAGAQTGILELAAGVPEKIDAHHWADAIRALDPYALRLREEFLDRLAQGLATLIMSLDPESIVLGTIIAANSDLFLEPLRERVRSLTWKELHGTQIEAAKLGPRLASYAAASAALLAFEDENAPRGKTSSHR
jgi:glucokinase